VWNKEEEEEEEGGRGSVAPPSPAFEHAEISRIYIYSCIRLLQCAVVVVTRYHELFGLAAMVQ
jgi:hypothetical protein